MPPPGGPLNNIPPTCAGLPGWTGGWDYSPVDYANGSPLRGGSAGSVARKPRSGSRTQLEKRLGIRTASWAIRTWRCPASCQPRAVGIKQQARTSEATSVLARMPASAAPCGHFSRWGAGDHHVKRRSLPAPIRRGQPYHRQPRRQVSGCGDGERRLSSSGRRLAGADGIAPPVNSTLALDPEIAPSRWSVSVPDPGREVQPPAGLGWSSNHTGYA